MRTVLTVLGVVIGTASIVVMLSLGIGLRQSVMEQASQAGGLTEIMVYSEGDYGASDEKVLGDDTISLFQEIEHVESVEPQIEYYMPVQAGKYEGTFEILGVSEEYLGKIELSEGSLPKNDKTALNLIIGNQVIDNFWEVSSGDYMEESPDINFMTMPLVGGIELEDDSSQDSDTTGDSDSDYVDSAFSDSDNDFESEDDFGDSDTTQADSAQSPFESDFAESEWSYSAFTSDVKRVRLKATGIVAGEEDDYTEYSYYCYTSLDALKSFLKQNYPSNSQIPGQPTDRSGKPFRELKYTMLTINVDESANVEEVLQTIQEMGYRGDANKEWLEELEKEYLIIEAVLGGIGAVAMLVAAISIANTMTMSTYERTKEIGIMKVLGCTLGNIRSMFLAEAAFIGLLGGVVGILLSYGLSMVANKVIAPAIMDEYDLGAHISVIPPWLVLAAIVFSTLIGMLAGFFPAQRATQLSPLAAIRND